MKKNVKPYCIMPWVHFHVGEKGNAKACCVAQIPFGNVNSDSLNEIWNGDSIKVLRQNFLDQKPDKRCHVCINQELAGVKSIRQETWDKFPEKREFPIEENEMPVYFDIRFSNVCNFRCRTCWHGASSKWFNEARQLKRIKSKQAILLNIDDFSHFINEFGTALKQAREIYFAGGEPLITEAHYLLLEWLIENDVKNCKLRYNTNFSTLKFKQWNIVALWQHFESIEILASIDGHEALGEYIRKEMNWQNILDNYQLIKAVKHIDFKLTPTVSVLSIYHLPDLYIKGIEMGLISPEKIYFNTLERPYYYNIKAFPAKQKELIETRYNSFFKWAQENKIPQTVIQNFKACLDFMNNEDLSSHWKGFLKETQVIDDLRQENIPSFWLRDLGLAE